MEQVLYRIGEASTHLGLQDKNSNTLRSWVEEFNEFLGSSANPEHGRPRFFTEDDLRTNHLPYSEIKARLAQGAYAVEQPRAAGEERAVAPTETALTVGDQVQSLLAPMARAADEWRMLAEQYRSRLEEREARVISLEQRVDGMQSRLEDLYTAAIKRAEPAAVPVSVSKSVQRKRRWLFG